MNYPLSKSELLKRRLEFKPFVLFAPTYHRLRPYLKDRKVVFDDGSVPIQVNKRELVTWLKECKEEGFDCRVDVGRSLITISVPQQQQDWFGL